MYQLESYLLVHCGILYSILYLDNIRLMTQTLLKYLTLYHFSFFVWGGGSKWSYILHLKKTHFTFELNN